MSKPTLEQFLADVQARVEAAALPLSQEDAARLMLAYHADAGVLLKMVIVLRVKCDCFRAKLTALPNQHKWTSSADESIEALIPEEEP